MRFFAAREAVYEQVRATLDAAWGLPDGTGTVTCYLPSADAPRAADGRIVLAVQDSFCEYTVAVDLLPQLLAVSDVDEISGDDYWAALHK